MAILGYKDIIQYPSTGANAVWATRTVSVLAGSDGTAVTTAPVTNLFEPSLNRVFQRANVLSGTVSIRIDLAYGGPAGASWLNYGLVGILGLRAIPSATSQGYDYDLDVRVRNFAGVDQRRTYYGLEAAGQWPRQVWFSTFTTSTDDAAAGRFCGGASGETAGITIDIVENMASNVPYTLEIGRIVLMNCFTGRFEPQPEIDFEESGALVRAFGGTPYSLDGARLRRIAGRFVGLPDQSVYGHSASEVGAAGLPWVSSIARISREAGLRGEAVLIPQDYATGVNVISGRNYYPSAWQTRPIFGRLDAGFRATRTATTFGGVAPGTQNNSLWSADVSITETPTV